MLIIRLREKLYELISLKVLLKTNTPVNGIIGKGLFTHINVHKQNGLSWDSGDLMLLQAKSFAGLTLEPIAVYGFRKWFLGDGY